MRFIQRYVDLPADLTYDQIAYDLTMRTVEVEEVIDTSAKFHDIVVGEIKEVKPHPNADALKICMTDVGARSDRSYAEAPTLRPDTRSVFPSRAPKSSGTARANLS